MVPCINQVTTLDTSFDDDLAAYSQAGWTAIELWLTKLETALQTQPIAEIKAKLDSQGLTPLGASSQGGLLSTRGEAFDSHREQFLRRIEWLRELGVGTLILTPDFLHAPTDAELRHAITTLAEVAKIAGSNGIRLALEFQKSSRFCASLDTTLAVVAQCGEPNVGVCLDLFHYYTGPSKFEDLAYLSAENLAWVQVCDIAGTPREVARDSDRILPGEGGFPDRADPRSSRPDRVQGGRLAGVAQPDALEHSRRPRRRRGLAVDDEPARRPSVGHERPGRDLTCSRLRFVPRRSSTGRSRTSAGGSTPCWP